MSRDVFSGRRPLLRRYLLACYVLMIVYASLSPFAGWQVPARSLWQAMAAPLGRAYTTFDAVANWLAYLPLGLLLALVLQPRFAALYSVLLATLAAAGLSLAMEYAQTFLPARTGAGIDVLTDTAGALCGALLAVAIAPRSWFARMTHWRVELLQRGAGVDYGLALGVLWVFAQINPSLPMLGNVFLTTLPASPDLPDAAFNLWGCLAVALNLWLIGLLLLTLLRDRRHALVALSVILCGVALGKFIMAAMLLRSWALMLWLNGEAVAGLVAGALLLGLSACLRGRQVLALMVLVAGAYLLLAFRLLDPTAPSAAMRLYHWHYGHLRNFNGMAQIVSMSFPLLLWLYSGLSRRRILDQDRRY